MSTRFLKKYIVAGSLCKLDLDLLGYICVSHGCIWIKQSSENIARLVLNISLDLDCSHASTSELAVPLGCAVKDNFD